MHIPRLFPLPRCLFELCFLALICLPLVAARSEPAGALNETPVELPKFFVTDSRILPPPEPWQYAAFPGYEVLSNASDRSTQRLVRDLRLFQTAVSAIWPLAQVRRAVPTTLILCGRRNAFDAFVPAGSDRPDLGLASLFLTDREQSAIIVDLQASTLNISTLAAPGGGATDAGVDSDFGFPVDHYRQLQREYIHFILGRSNPRPPAWLDEGLAQMFMAMEFDRKTIVFARVEVPGAPTSQNASDTSGTEPVQPTGSGLPPTVRTAPIGPQGGSTSREDGGFNTALQRTALMPLQEMFDVKPDSDVARKSIGSRWAKQCYAWVHYCLYSTESTTLRKSLLAFVARTSKEPPTETVFKECFGQSYEDMLRRLRSYIEFTAYKSLEFRVKGEGLPEPEPLALRGATQSEVGRIKGEAMIMAGRGDQARDALIAPYIRDEHDPRLLASLGLHELSAGRNERARTLLEAAAKANVLRPSAYLALARLRLTEALAQPAGAAGKLSAGQVAKVLEPLNIARVQPPSMPEVYLLVAEAWAKCDAAPTEEQFGALAEGIAVFPHNSELVYQCAALSLQLGRIPTAADLIDLGLKGSRDDATRVRFEELQSRLPPLPPAPASPESR